MNSTMQHLSLNPESQARYLYEVRGDPESSLLAYNGILGGTSSEVTNNSSPEEWARNHNLALLSNLSKICGDTGDSFSESDFFLFLKELHSKTTFDKISDENKKVLTVSQLILGHNLALNYLIRNDAESGNDVLLPIFMTYLHDDCDCGNIELGDVRCKIAFLLLDCILTLRKVDRTEDILRWINRYITTHSKPKWTEQNLRASSLVEGITELKFRFNCYKSRTLFLLIKFDEQMKRDANTRLARKELKSAMEIFHHKLATKRNHVELGDDRKSNCIGTAYSRGESTDGGGSFQDSLGSNSNDPQTEPISACGYPGNAIDSRSALQSKKLDIQSQCALYMKANLEFLKNNTKKALKLCSEAQNAGERQRDFLPLNVAHDDNTSESQYAVNKVENQRTEVQHLSNSYSAVHYNNLAVAYQAVGKVHIALHYYARSLRHLEMIEQNNKESIIDVAGMANPLPTCEILYNTALCAQQATKFLVSYECMARCIKASPRSFAKDPQCWLHLAESCIGSHSNLKRKGRKEIRSMKSRMSNIPSGAAIDSATITPSYQPKESMKGKELPNELGSQIDLEMINDNPLPRSLDFLNHSLRLCEKRYTGTNDFLNESCRESVRVTLAYVWMELNNPASVMRLADLVLKAPPLMINSSHSSSEGGNVESFCNASRRRRATMQMYACEASCMFGNPSRALKYLVDIKADRPKNDDDDDCSYYYSQWCQSNNDVTMARDLALLSDSSKQPLKTWEGRRFNDAKTSVRIALAGSLIYSGRIDIAKELIGRKK